MGVFHVFKIIKMVQKIAQNITVILQEIQVVSIKISKCRNTYAGLPKTHESDVFSTCTNETYTNINNTSIQKSLRNILVVAL